MRGYRGITLIEPIIRNSKPLLMVTFPSTHSVTLALALLMVRYYLGLETHLTFAGSINDERVLRLIQGYDITLLIGLENNAQANPQGNVILLSHTPSNLQQVIDPTTIGPLNNWPTIARRLYLTYLVGLTLDENSIDASSILSAMANDGLVELKRQSLPLSLHSDPLKSLHLNPWPTLIEPSAIKASDADGLVSSIITENLRFGFMGSYTDYLLLNTPYINGVNAALLYVFIESMLWRSTQRDDGLMVPIIDLATLGRVVMGRLEGVYDAVEAYMNEVRGRLRSILGESRGERMISHELKPSHLTLMNRLCQVLSFHRLRNSIRLMVTYDSLSIICIPNPNVEVSMSNILSYNRSLRITQVVTRPSA